MLNWQRNNWIEYYKFQIGNIILQTGDLLYIPYGDKAILYCIQSILINSWGKHKMGFNVINYNSQNAQKTIFLQFDIDKFIYHLQQKNVIHYPIIKTSGS